MRISPLIKTSVFFTVVITLACGLNFGDHYIYSRVTYDRAGMAWSESGPAPRTSTQMVHELHMLLEKAKIPKPYILVGLSFEGITVQLYAIEYPDEILGLVLVDSAHEDELIKAPPHPLYDIFNTMNSEEDNNFKSTFGFSSFVTKKYIEPKLFSASEKIRNSHLLFSSSYRHNLTNALEAEFFSKGLKQLAKSDRSDIQNKPCFVITAGLIEDMSIYGVSKVHQKQIYEKQIIWLKVWHELQENLTSKFINAQHIIAEKSDHSIIGNQPELIISAIKNIIETKTN